MGICDSQVLGLLVQIIFLQLGYLLAKILKSYKLLNLGKLPLETIWHMSKLYTVMLMGDILKCRDLYL